MQHNFRLRLSWGKQRYGWIKQQARLRRMIRNHTILGRLTECIHDLEVYLCSSHDPFKVNNIRCDMVSKLTQTIQAENCNVIIDNWFTSREAGKKLFKKKTRIMGTIRKDKIGAEP